MPNSEIKKFSDVPAGVERSLRLAIRVMMNKNDGTFTKTNAEADEIAMVILRNFKVEEK